LVAVAGVYRRILVPVRERRGCDQAMAVACGIAAERGAVVTVLTAVEVPPEFPLDAEMLEEEAGAEGVLVEARAIAELYGVTVRTRVARARSAGEAIVSAADGVEIVVLGAPRKRRASPRSPVFGRTVAFVLQHAPCRVMVAAPPPS